LIGKLYNKNNKMNFKNKNIQKLISCLVIIGMMAPAIFLFSAPKKTDAFLGFGDIVFDVPTEISTTKEVIYTILEQVLMAIARKVLEKMTQSTVNWINQGFHGSPLFLENSDSFFKDIAKSEVKNLVNLFGYDSLKYPFGKNFALSIINDYKATLENNAAYTLSSVINDQAYLYSFQNDFNVGGWNGFLINTQYPQNNYLGFQMMATEALARRVQGTGQTAIEKVKTTLEQGQGFLSPQTCPSNQKYNNGTNEFNRPSFKETTEYNFTCDPKTSDNDCELEKEAYDKSYNAKVATEKAEWAETNECPGGLFATTPGSVVSGQIMKALGAPQDSTSLAAAMGNSLSAIFDALLNKFLGDGLNSLANTDNPPPSQDNWSYDGQTLGGSGSTSPNTLNIPKNVSIKLGDTTNPSSISIAGGTAPYLIEIPPEFTTASAKISGSTLTITGSVPGNTSVTVADSSIPSKKASVQIAVFGSGELMIVPANISVNVNDQASAMIYGGKEPYIMLTEPNQGIAMGILGGSSLVVAGLRVGQTAVVIKDSSVPAKIATIPISVTNSSGLATIPQDVSIEVGQTVGVTISGGVAGYIIETPPNASVATAAISDTALIITGVAPGQTTIIIKDSSSPAQTTSINVQTVP